MIIRTNCLDEISTVLSENPICALLGPRQCGKTTLARQYADLATSSRRSNPNRVKVKSVHLFDLEKASDLARLSNPELALTGLSGLIIIDEIQRQPELFETLRPLADNVNAKSKYLILGSASPRLIKDVSESLAGRVGFVDLGGFTLQEVEDTNRLWLRGGFPRSYLSSSDAASLRWRQNFVRTFLERDIRELGIRIPSERLRRFWMMLAHYHGQIFNGSELARSLGTTETTVRHYLDILSETYVVRQIQPWFENIGKRQYKSPKVYIRDSGIMHALLDIETESGLQGHPKFGASWEGFAIEEIIAQTRSHQHFYWGTHSGAELDLLLFYKEQRIGIEFKAADAPGMTKSLHIALNDLKLDKAYIVYPGVTAYKVHDLVQVVSIEQLVDLLG